MLNGRHIVFVFAPLHPDYSLGTVGSVLEYQSTPYEYRKSVLGPQTGGAI